MTERYPFEFGEWYPDLEPYAHTGLVTAENVIHQPDGYAPVYDPTAGAFSTFTPPATTTSPTTITSMMARPVGTNGQKLIALTYPTSASGAALRVEFLSADEATGELLAQESFSSIQDATGTVLTTFQVTEFEETAVWVARVDYTDASGTAVAHRQAYYVDFS